MQKAAVILLAVLVSCLLNGCASPDGDSASSRQAVYKYQVQYKAEATPDAPTEDEILNCAEVVLSDRELTDEEVTEKLIEQQADRDDIDPDTIVVWQIDRLAP